jgi:hypothetical protein
MHSREVQAATNRRKEDGGEGKDMEVADAVWAHETRLEKIGALAFELHLRS